MLNIFKPLALVTLFFLSGCGGDSSIDSVVSDARQFGVFKVQDDNTTVEMNGEISSNTLNNFNALLANFPTVEQINIVNCDGSSDDEVNLQVSKLVHDKGINTHLNDNGEIASGGVDFYLAGIKRTRGTNTKIGVHSWSDEEDQQASDFPREHANHQPYINYYTSIGFTQQEAEDFYYFTIYAATADSIHYMTDAEVALYKMVKE